MFGKYLLPILGLLSIVWIAYIGLDLLVKSNDFSPSYIFGKEDGNILVIHRSDEYKMLNSTFKPSPKAGYLYEHISPWLNNEKMVILSEKRNHILIEIKDQWTRNAIINLFLKIGETVNFTALRSFTMGDYKGKFHHNILYITANKFTTSKVDDSWLKFDKKASATLIYFSNESFVSSDIYWSTQGETKYVSKYENGKNYVQLEDERLFAGALPDQLEDYHFYEKEYFKSVDSLFAISPMYKWIETGLVSFSFKGAQVWLTDFKAGQEPILAMHEFGKDTNYNNEETEAFFNRIDLCSNLTSKKGFYIKYMDGFAVLSTSKSACDHVVASFRLGETLSMNKPKLKKVYGRLPKRVSERYVSNDLIYTRTFYKDKVFETYLQSGYDIEEPKLASSTSNSTISMVVGNDIKYIHSFNEKGNVLAISQKGIIFCYKKGDLIWKKDFGQSLIGDVDQIVLQSTRERVWCFSTKNKIHLLDSLGNSIPGFPIQVQGEIKSGIQTIDYRGALLFAFVTTENQLMAINQKNQMIFNQKLDLSDVVNRPLLWISQSYLLSSIDDGKTNIIFNVTSKKELRRFGVLDHSISRIVKNEFKNFGIQNNSLYEIDQKGNKHELVVGVSGELFVPSLGNGMKMLAIKNEQIIQFISYFGEKFGEVKVPFKDLENVYVNKSSSNMTYVSLVDGIENNVYLFDIKGHQLRQIPYKGKLMSKISWSATNELILTTVVDDYVIQYIEN
jgi:hypothetical protein